jgi:superfamily II DNA/RNA helicase
MKAFMSDTFDVRGDFSPAQDIETTTDLATTPALPNGFVKLGLAPELLQAVEDLGFLQPTAVQDAAIPRALPGGDDGAGFIDLMVSSQTGSGKTAAFLLPVLHTLLQQQRDDEARERQEQQRLADEAAARGEAPPKRKRRNPTDPRNFKAATPGALILSPTRELAQQVAHDAIDLVKHCRGLRIANGPTTRSTSGRCWTTGCATRPSTRPSCSRRPRSSAMRWRATCSRPASRPSRCTAR